MALTSAISIPSFIKSALEGRQPIKLTFSDIKDTNVLSTSSFIYDPQDAPMKSTQQLNVDWSKFENHTFFMSAEAKVNLAFEQIINGYPFDGTRLESEKFFESLSGFDKWVFDSFPKYKGQLMFTGTVNAGSDRLPTAGSYIIVKDYAGSLYPELSKNKSGTSILNPKQNSLTIEMQLFLPKSPNENEVICQKLNGKTQGFSLYVNNDTSALGATASFSVISSSYYLSVPCILEKGKFNHVCVTLDNDSSISKLKFFNNLELCGLTTASYKFGTLDIDSADLIIGSGSTVNLGNITFTPTQTLTGTLDEFRIFHSSRSVDQQKLYAKKSIFAQPDLKLYYKFNEPGPPLTTANTNDPINAIVLDSSGNSLHSVISNFYNYVDVDVNSVVTGSKLRLDASKDITSNVLYEKPESVPVLFPAHQGVIDLNEALLYSASEYDKANPNLITKLIPRHYLLEGALQDGFIEPEGNGGNPYESGIQGIPGDGKLGNVQIMLSLLYVWSRFFDEMKLFVDSFSLVRTVDYDTNSSMPNNFLQNLLRQYGLHMPSLFADSTIEQHIYGENIENNVSTSESSIKNVQNELLRRIIINLPDVIKSKGTQHSIKSFLRAIGIDPDNSIRLKEYGGPTMRQLTCSREDKKNIDAMIQFTPTSWVITPPLTASRVEVGSPNIRGQYVQKDIYYPHGQSNNPSDGRLTSGSFTVETFVKFNNVSPPTTPQSVIRTVLGDPSNFDLSVNCKLISNLVVIPGKDSTLPTVNLYVRPTRTQNYVQLSLQAPDIFNGEKWYISFGREPTSIPVSSSYFLRVASRGLGDVETFASTSSYHYVDITDYDIYSRWIENDTPPVRNEKTAVMIAAGQGQKITFNTSGQFLCNSKTSADITNPYPAPVESRALNFTGKLSNLRFWSKKLSDSEWLEHVRNHNSLGVNNPYTNYNFEQVTTGSFERLRIDTLRTQDAKRANAEGSITFIDYSLNRDFLGRYFHVSGSGFPINEDCVKGEIFYDSHLSPHFDEAVTNEKVRIRSFQDQALVNSAPWAQYAPMYELVKSEKPTDDTRFSIEFSLIDALNRDIINMFSTLETLDNALGSPELLFSPDYPDLERLRNVYFNRLREKLNFGSFFEFFKWFDLSIGTFISQLVPRKTNFRGTNFLIESHVLERHKLEYYTNEQYLSESVRNRIKDVLLLQQIVGSVRKF